MSIIAFWDKIKNPTDSIISQEKEIEKDEKVFTKLKTIIDLNNSVLVKSVKFSEGGFEIEFYERRKVDEIAQADKDAKKKKAEKLLKLIEEEKAVAELALTNPEEFEDAILNGDLLEKEDADE